MSDIRKGSCLCGSVHLEAKLTDSHIGACHCGMCQKWGGGPLLCVDGGTDVAIKGKEVISSYRSSDWAERAFCSKCGSHLYYLLNGKQYFIPVGLLQTLDGLEFTRQIFIDKKPASYSFANSTECLTEAEVFAKYANPEGHLT